MDPRFIVLIIAAVAIVWLCIAIHLENRRYEKKRDEIWRRYYRGY